MLYRLFIFSLGENLQVKRATWWWTIHFLLLHQSSKYDLSILSCSSWSFLAIIFGWRDKHLISFPRNNRKNSPNSMMEFLHCSLWLNVVFILLDYLLNLNSPKRFESALLSTFPPSFLNVHWSWMRMEILASNLKEDHHHFKSFIVVVRNIDVTFVFPTDCY